GHSPRIQREEKQATTGPSVVKKIVVDLGKQRAYAYEGDKVVREMGVSSGKRGHGTTPGRFSVTEHDANHRSSTYGKCDNRDVSGGAAACKKGETYVGASMKWFLRFNGPEGLHQGVLPGYPASHGCVRLSGGDAKWLFDWAPDGTSVEVKPG